MTKKKRTISLERQAKANLDICCNSLCHSSIVEEYIEELELRVHELELELAMYKEKRPVKVCEKNSG